MYMPQYENNILNNCFEISTHMWGKTIKAIWYQISNINTYLQKMAHCGQKFFKEIGITQLNYATILFKKVKAIHSQGAHLQQNLS